MHVFIEYTAVAVVHMIYYGDIILVCRASYLTMKTTYNYVLYLFADSLSWTEPKYQSTKVTIALHVIDEFIFNRQYTKERRVCTYIITLAN